MRRYLFFLLLSLGGCVKIPDYLMDEIPHSLGLQNSIERALKLEEFQAGPWPEANWWEWFSDSQLSELIQEGLENSPDLKKVAARMKESQQIAEQIKARFFPHINFKFQDNYEHLSAHGFEREFAFHGAPPNQTPPALIGFNPAAFATPVPAVLHVIDLGFNMDWELDFFGKNNERWKGALDIARATEAEAKQSQLVASSQIAQAYFSLQTHMAVLAIYRQLNDVKKNLKDLTALRNQVGLDTELMVLTAENQVATAEKLIADYEEMVRLDKTRLFVLIGLNPDSERTIQPYFTTLEAPFPIPNEISSNFLARRPDLIASIWRTEKAAADIRVAKLEFYPSVNLQGLAVFRSVFPKDLFSLSPSSIADSLLPSFTLPIFKGNQLRSNLKEKIAAFEEAAQIYHDTLLHALQEVADLLARVETSGTRIREQQGIYSRTLKLKELTAEQYSVGTSNYLELLDQEFECLNQKNALLTLQSNHLLLAVKLMQALGGGYQSPDDVPDYFVKDSCCEKIE